MHIRKGLAVLSVLMAPVVFAACGDDGADQPQRPPPLTSDQPQATQPAAGAPAAGAPATQTEGPALAAGALPAGVTQEMVNQGREIFHGQGICFTCHGQNAVGTPLGPNLADDDWLWIEGQDDLYEQILAITRTGVTTPAEYPAPMPPMGGVNLNDDQLRAVTAYVYSLNTN